MYYVTLHHCNKDKEKITVIEKYIMICDITNCLAPILVEHLPYTNVEVET